MRSGSRFALFFFVAALLSYPPPVAADDLRVLFLSKSAGFEHSVVRRTGGEPSHADRVLAEIAEREGWELTTTKDASLINAEDLAKYDVVIFMTTGDLTATNEHRGIIGGEGSPTMPANGVADLTAWVEAGGGFVGFHCATDTFHGADGEVSPYIALIGGEFKTHGAQFEGTVSRAAPEHPVAASFPEKWKIKDEWYVLTNISPDVEVIAELLPGPAREAQKKIYDFESQAIAWTIERGEGRVYYNAMGHREDVWSNATFQRTVVDAINWGAGN